MTNLLFYCTIPGSWFCCIIPKDLFWHELKTAHYQNNWVPTVKHGRGSIAYEVYLHLDLALRSSQGWGNYEEVQIAVSISTFGFLRNADVMHYDGSTAEFLFELLWTSSTIAFQVNSYLTRKVNIVCLIKRRSCFGDMMKSTEWRGTDSEIYCVCHRHGALQKTITIISMHAKQSSGYCAHVSYLALYSFKL